MKKANRMQAAAKSGFNESFNLANNLLDLFIYVTDEQQEGHKALRTMPALHSAFVQAKYRLTTMNAEHEKVLNKLKACQLQA